jgi:hypothetical protein
MDFEQQQQPPPLLRSASEPFVYDKQTPYTASQGEQFFYPSTHSQITSENRAAKIRQFIDDLPSLKKIRVGLLPPKEEGIVRIYYFIGRLNPPHDGHIKTLSQLIQTAMDQNPDNPHYKIIILLGSGPKKGNILDNPLSFATKKDFIEAKLKELFPDNPPNFIFDQNVEILEMANAPQQIAKITQTTLPLVSNLIEEINMYRFSGAKDGDDEKLNWIETTLRKILLEYASVLTTKVVPVIPITDETGENAVSATDIRVDILKGILTGDPFKNLPKYISRNVYDLQFGERIFNEIAVVANEKGTEAIENYIKQKSKKGGSRKTKTRRRRTRKTKRRKTKRRRSRRSRMN